MNLEWSAERPAIARIAKIARIDDCRLSSAVLAITGSRLTDFIIQLAIINPGNHQSWQSNQF